VSREREKKTQSRLASSLRGAVLKCANKEASPANICRQLVSTWEKDSNNKVGLSHLWHFLCQRALLLSGPDFDALTKS
jgi:hypothetical protein